MTDFDAAVDWLVESGRVASRGAAKRSLIEHVLNNFERGPVGSEHPKGWSDRIADGLAGAGPYMPNIAKASEGLNLITPGAGAAAQTGIALVERAIGYSGEELADIVHGLTEALNEKTTKPVSKRPWWKRLFGG